MKRLSKLLLLFLASCTSVYQVRTPQNDLATTFAPAAQSHATSAPVRIVADWDNEKDGHFWTEYTVRSIREIGASLLASKPRDVAAFCPAYGELPEQGRLAFWTALLSAMARQESRFKPGVSFNEQEHCRTDDCRRRMSTRDGRPVISRGLLQISQESANSYQGCAVAPAEEERLHEPELNIRCSVAIAAGRMRSDGVISERADEEWRGLAAYWSVLRAPNERETLAKIRQFTNSTRVCQI